MNQPPEKQRARLSEIEELVSKFESCSLTPAEFDHPAHVIVGLWYVAHTSSLAEAAARMGARIRRLLAFHREDPAIYNETITVFWLRRIRSCLDARGANIPLDELANSALEACRDPRLIFRYYGKERLASTAAKTGWSEPDVRPLDF